MPSWNDLLQDFENQPNNQEKSHWLTRTHTEYLKKISTLRSGRHVLIYGSAFLQKPMLPAPILQLGHEEINAFMSVIYGMDWSKGLTLILHTPGGVTNAAETVVEYLFSKFDSIEVIVPTLAMSAGTMIALASDRIVMGRHSQLGPIDPQIPVGSRAVSAQAILDQFDEARREILGTEMVPGNTDAAHLWAPILQSLGPALLQEAKNANLYAEEMVRRWLKQRMFSKCADPDESAKSTAKFFNDAGKHKSHGRRIGREEAREGGHVIVEDLEDDQNLQDAVLTAYHLCTIVFEKSPAAKLLRSDHERMWVKNWQTTIPKP